MHLCMKKKCLLPGPNLNPDLLSVLVYVRQHKIALTADIRKAFLQISLNEIDKDVLRFLWTMKTPVSMNDISISRMTRVPFGVSSSIFLLAATIRHHLKKFEGQYPEVATIINECLYVDDLITGAHTVKGALKLTQAAKEILSTAGMQLCKWTTNSAALRKEWTHRMSAVMVNIENKTTVKVLGLIWKTETDEIIFDMTELIELIIVKNKRGTKKTVLQTPARIFDPLSDKRAPFPESVDGTEPFQ